MILRWQYIPAWLLYSLITIATLPLMLRFRLTPAHLILANPSLPWGGMQIASKAEIMKRFQGAAQYLKQVYLPNHVDVDSNLHTAKEFHRVNDLGFPLVAKPDQACVGFGVRMIHKWDDLRKVLMQSPVDYILQEFASQSQEYGIFFSKKPGHEFGRITGLTHKMIPSVMGDGQSTVRELIYNNHSLSSNRKSLLKHVSCLEHVPRDRESVKLLVQASHTYGACFRDISDLVTPEMEKWVNEFMAQDPAICHGRLDVMAEDIQCLNTGRGVSVIEFNGCFAEPIHIYDDKHTLRFGIKTFYQTYRDAYLAASANRGVKPVEIMKMISAYRTFYRNKKMVQARIG